MLKWLWVSAVVIVLDRVTKALAVSKLIYGQPAHVFPGLNLTLAFNTGAAFSFLSSADGWQRWLFVGIALVVSAAIVGWLWRVPKGAVWMPLALTLVLGGALGNVWDRFQYGYVIDFIDVYYRSYHWPAFNIADSAITVGAVMLLIEAFFGRRSQA